MPKHYTLLLPVFLVVCALSNSSRSDGSSPAPEPAAPTLQQAENVDLKDVVESSSTGGVPAAVAVKPTATAEPVTESQQPVDVAADAAADAGNAVKPATHVDLKDIVEEVPATSEPALPEASAPSPGQGSLDNTEIAPQTAVPGGEAAEAGTPTPELLQAEPLIMLNSEVMPGTSARLSWTPNVSFMGIAAPTPVLVVHGAKPGPRVCLTAAIHGDELNGIEVVRHVLYSVDPNELSGTLIGVPIVNLQGFRRSSRYLPDRRDLNRYFPGNARGSSASRIARSFFSSVVERCDMLVDLHTGSFHRTNLPQLRANLKDPDVAALTGKMGSIVVVHSVGRPGCLRRAAVEAGIPAVTLEAGQPHELQKNAVSHGIKSIETLLDTLGMLDRRPFWEFKSEPVFYQSRWVRATAGGILFSEVELGDRVKAGTLLGVITDPITNNRQDILAPVAGRVIGMALNQVMYPGFAAYHIGLHSSVEEVKDDRSADTSDAAEEDGDLPAPEEMSPVETDERLLEDS